MVLEVLGTFLEEFFGELVDFVVVFALDGVDQRFELVLLTALHQKI